ncbi:MAG TPA: ATP-binding protein [Methanomicrobiales archaeon]|jgi:signal transduction histidine kinase|nr:ATP-binding protein [Methanomicrobiales archaeon]
MPITGKISDEDLIKILWAVSIPLTTLLAMMVTIFSVTHEMTDVFPHLYYIPILLNAYRNPRKAIEFAGILGAGYAVLVYTFTGFSIDPLIKALIRVLVFIWVAAIISYLSGNLDRRNRVLAAMNEIIAAASTSATLDEILSTAGKKIREILVSEIMMVFLVDPDGKRASLRYEEGLPGPARKDLGSIDLEGEPFRHLLAGGLAEIPGELRPFGPTPFPGISSFVVIPLSAGTQLLGVVAAGCRKSSPLDMNEMRMLESVSRVIGSAVKKTLLQEELGEANTKANLYLDIMAHDINNVNTVSLGYAQLLGDMLTGKGREMLRKLESAITQSVDIIRNVSTIRRIQEQSQANRPLDLDPVIRSELGHHPDITLHYGGTTASVCANSLISEVFRNLIGNSAKFGGTGSEIWIEVAEDRDRVTVSVEDSGPGIPDELKPLIFNRFQKGKSRKSGKGLGLYISRMIVEGYGGRIWADDRVKGEPGKGAAIRFTLPKACTA